MNKVFKGLLSAVISSFLFLGLVNAASIEIGSGEAYANEKGKTVDIVISGSDLSDYIKIEFEVSISSENADIVSVSPKLSAAGMEFANNNSVYTITNNEGLEGDILLTLEYNTYEDFIANFTITPVNVKLYKADNEVVILDAKSIKAGGIKHLAPASSDATLKSLTVSQGELTPQFDKDTLDYTVNVEDKISFITISVTPADKAKAEGYGRKQLELGENKFEIKVTAEDKKTTKTYKITIVRGEVNEISPYLKDLVILTTGCELSPEFDKSNNKYTVNAPAGTTELELDYTSVDKEAIIFVTGNNNFTEGENKVIIKVTSSDEKEIQEYEIIVNVDKESDVIPAPPLEPESEKKKPDILIIIGISVIIVLIVTLVGILLFKKKKPKAKVKVEDSIQEKKEPVLFEDEKTSTYDINAFKEAETNQVVDKTKEYHFNFDDDEEK